ncbi:MAG: metallophosphoesterase [Syntrophobacteraceae bacterium]
MRKPQCRRCAPAPAVFVSVLLLLLVQASCAFAEQWSFAMFADSRFEFAALRTVLEQIRSNKPADPKFPATHFVLGLGDIDPLTKTAIIHKEVFGSAVPFVPVRGNHESAADFRYMRRVLLPALPFPLQYKDAESTTYFFDYKNARFISIDQYMKPGKDLRNPEMVAWVEKAIVSARKLDHIFISFHEPHLPLTPENDPFWIMLLKNSNKVRAVLTGHTHTYLHRPVPGPHGSIHFINTGNAGNRRHSDGNLTTVQVAIDANEVYFRTIQAPHGSRDFKVTERWSGGKKSSGQKRK